jgi:hypothetical protein
MTDEQFRYYCHKKQMIQLISRAMNQHLNIRDNIQGIVIGLTTDLQNAPNSMCLSRASFPTEIDESDL